MNTSTERILKAVEYHRIEWGDIIQRVASDTGDSAAVAAVMVSDLEGGVRCSTPVAAAIIEIISERAISR